MNHFVFVLCALVTITSASSLSWKIVGGQDAAVGQFPYHVSIRTNGRHNCGGSIINNRWVLTAAQCLDKLPTNNLTVAVGTIRTNDPNARVYKVESTTMHDNYVSRNTGNDVGVIRLTEDIQFYDNVQMIPLNTEDIGGGYDLTLSGFGRLGNAGDSPENLQWIRLRSLTVEECQSRHANSSGSIYDTQICTLTQTEEGACKGDGGSPLVKNGIQVGIFSWLKPCARGYPDVHTRVSSFVSWINKQIAKYNNN